MVGSPGGNSIDCSRPTTTCCANREVPAAASQLVRGDDRAVTFPPSMCSTGVQVAGSRLPLIQPDQVSCCRQRASSPSPRTVTGSPRRSAPVTTTCAARKRPHEAGQLPGAPEEHPQPCRAQQPPSCSCLPHHPGVHVVNAQAGVVQKATAQAVPPAVPAMADDGHARILQGATMLICGVLPIFDDPPQLSHE
jgi:hypothetical protein